MSDLGKLTPSKIVMLLVPCAILNSFAMDIFAPAIPKMIDYLGTTEQKIQYILITFMLAVGIGQPSIGLLCDKLGRRQTMLSSIALFIFSSFATTLSTSVELLALLRFFQGLGACGALVVTFAVVNDTFHGRDAFRIFSMIGCALALTPMIAPILGVGLMNASGSWQICFHFLAFFGLGAGIYCYCSLPETKPADTQVPTLSNLAKGYKQILSTPQFTAYTLFATTSMAQLYLYFSIGNILFINKLGASPFEFSLIFAFNAVIYLIGNYLSTYFQKKLSAYRLTMAGSVICVLGSLLMVSTHTILGLKLAWVILANSVMTIGVGFMIGPATGAALAPFKKLAGTASGLFGMLQYGLPSLIGLFVTRFPIQSSLSIALPMLFMSTLSVAAGYRLLQKEEAPEIGT